jgi:hypothetical protein
MLTVKEMVKDGALAHFSHFENGVMWYQTAKGGFNFPVPINELDTACLLPSEKAILLMKYINRQVKHIQKTGAGETVSFVRYQNNEMWYRDKDNFEFPVPVKIESNFVVRRSELDKDVMVYHSLRHKQMLIDSRAAQEKNELDAI